MPLNYIANRNALDVFQVRVGDEGKKYSCGLTVAIQRQIVCIERPLFDKSQKCVEAHRMHFNSGLYFSKANIPQT